jgi:hypothetical protein
MILKKGRIAPDKLLSGKKATINILFITGGKEWELK